MSFAAGKKTTCPNCGAVFEDPVVFCGSCGTRIPQKAAPAAAVQSPPQQASPPTRRGGAKDYFSPPEAHKPVQPKAAAAGPLAPIVPAAVPSAPVSSGPLAPIVPGAVPPSRPKSGPLAPIVPGAVPPTAHAAVADEPPKKSSKPPESKRPGKRKSTRPVAPGIAEWGADPDHEQKLLDEVDAGFYSIIQPRPEAVDDEWGVPSNRPAAARTYSSQPSAPKHADPDPVDVAAAVELFEQLAPIYARPIRDFMLDVAWGDASRHWLEVCVPAAKSLRVAADKMDLGELRTSLDDFLAALEVVAGTTEQVIGPDAKEMLQGVYGKLVTVMPHVFGLEQERGRREPMIVRSLILQVRGVGKVTLDKVFGAGLTGLEMLYAARPAELAVTSGIPLEVAQAICDRFQAYRTEVQQSRPDGGRQADLKKLEALARELRTMNEAFKGAASGWSAQSAKDKRWLRTERERVFLEIKVVLARSGEVELLEELERLPFERKQGRLDSFLQETRSKGP